MAVCPKCGFAGHDPDTCERCGVIFARVRPDGGHAATPASVRPAPRGRESTNPGLEMMAIPTPGRTTPVGGAPAKGPKGSRPGRGHGPASKADEEANTEVTMIPIVPPAAPSKSRAPMFLGILAVCLLLWGLSLWRDHRRQAEGSQQEADTVQDAEYYDIAVTSLVQDTQTRFKHPGQPDAMSRIKTELFKRERYLRVKLTNAPMSEAHRAALDTALDDVAVFLKAQVLPPPPAAGTTEAVAQEIPAATDLSRLDHASGLLSSLPQ